MGARLPRRPDCGTASEPPVCDVRHAAAGVEPLQSAPSPRHDPVLDGGRPRRRPSGFVRHVVAPPSAAPSGTAPERGGYTARGRCRGRAPGGARA